MTIKTNAPHWSLWSIDQRIAELQLPEEPANPLGAWRGLWELSETVNSNNRRQILGQLEIHHMPQGNRVQLSITHRVPTTQGRTVASEIVLECQNDDLLTPIHWVSEFATHAKHTDLSNTRASQQGEVKRGWFSIEGTDISRTRLPRRVPLTSSYSLVAALPRVLQAGVQRLEFAMLDELTVLREEQILERIDTVSLELGSGPVELQGYRYYGRGTTPVHCWLGPHGMPLFVCSLGTALVAQELEDLDGAEE